MESYLFFFPMLLDGKRDFACLIPQFYTLVNQEYSPCLTSNEGSSHPGGRVACRTTVLCTSLREQLTPLPTTVYTTKVNKKIKNEEEKETFKKEFEAANCAVCSFFSLLLHTEGWGFESWPCQRAARDGVYAVNLQC